jgi:drug/metabolite transporter (DMT)-like permease
MLDRGTLIVSVCVVVMTVGQILFKLVAVNYNRLGILFDWRVLGVLAIAGILYVTSTGLWVWALRSMELSNAYPLFALGFVLVPIASAALFGETLTLRYAAGVGLIVAGVILTSR